MWHEGTYGIQISDRIKYAHFWVKALNETSPNGLNGGKITQLVIKTNNTYTCHYDEGWEIEPVDDQITQIVLTKLIEKYN